uniref:Uncharacterized protein n=1 Tax=Leersia perrieri TaxID=77586 RepID=A0A0D9WUU5_9ORYZ
MLSQNSFPGESETTITQSQISIQVTGLKSQIRCRRAAPSRAANRQSATVLFRLLCTRPTVLGSPHLEEVWVCLQIIQCINVKVHQQTNARAYQIKVQRTMIKNNRKRLL